jgi:cytochrome c oxidase subunit II
MISGRTCWALAATALAVAGCRDVQSVLSPHGPGAAQIAQLAWLLFGFGAVVLAIVVVALWLAVRGPATARARLADTRAVLVGGVAFPAITLTGLLAYGIWLTQASVSGADHADPVRIEVIGEQWWWRVAYIGSDGRPVADANEIHIPVGRQVEFTLKSADVIHSFWVPSLGGKVDMIPGRTTQLRLTADRPGEYRGQCAEYCGGPHALMALLVVAMPVADFEAWLAAQSRPAVAQETPAAGRGRDLFIAAGCGACHTIRGTPAVGSLGPDLTHVGSRRSVGLDTLPMTSRNLARFIADGQHIKPGNRMPPFRVFSEDELDAVAAYLAGLR